MYGHMFQGGDGVSKTLCVRFDSLMPMPVRSRYRFDSYNHCLSYCKSLNIFSLMVKIASHVHVCKQYEVILNNRGVKDIVLDLLSSSPQERVS